MPNRDPTGSASGLADDGRIDDNAVADDPGRLPPTAPTPSIALRFDDWMLPKAGVAFVWVLEREMVPSTVGGAAE
jgi:hypothetical protein